MTKKTLSYDVAEQLRQLGCHIIIIESLIRILFECTQNYDNLKYYDVESLIRVLVHQIKDLHNEFEKIDKSLRL